MKRLTAADFTDLQRIARGYCRTVDSTRSRKRMDGSASVVRNGSALYGTDDVSDDVTQDAVLIFAKRLGEIIAKCEISAVWVDTREPSAWQYVRRDGETIVVTRKTLQYWAVRDAAARNGYRLDVKPEEIDATPGKQITRGIPHADKLSTLAVTPYLSGNSETIFRSAWGDGSEYPTLRGMLRQASNSDDLGRAGVLGKTAQELYGGPLNSSSKVQRARDAGIREWRALSASLDAVRDELIYRGARQQKDD
ncbi:hypothetical protein [Streptomyces fulvoviolaceus]|uniref:hypothetical protein n=1 Tax=Streptomyces fulvoviolaceus TaxID=285535 RepID=UPI0021C1AE47|nr:hypothetical protein [Streptomyces fulvoviolaceus]MCT9080476.1 hypothetical protein [Streptomyces fulvoviolaceus]